MKKIYEEPKLPEFLREGGYRMLSCLSAGSDRSVYLIGDTVGKKYILKRAAGEEEALLEKEARQMEKYDFSFLPRFFCFKKESDASYLLRSYIEGDTLEEIVGREGPMSGQRAQEIMARLCDIAAKLHNQKPPLVHRDMKPSNIVLTPEGNLFLIDLGTMREYDPALSRDTQIVGTRGTAAPEQYGFCQTDARADIYALGVTYCYLLTGEMYGKGRRSYAALSQSSRRVIETCTKLGPQERYQGAAQLKEALCTAGGVKGMARFRISPLFWRRKKRSVYVKTIVLPAVILSGIALFAVFERKTVYSFHSETIEAAVRAQLEKSGSDKVTKEDLKRIEVLRICGGEILSEEDLHWQYCTSHRINEEENDTRGQIKDLGDLPHMKNLRELVLDRQQISDISALKGLALEKLSLCDNPLKDLSPLSGNDTLRVLSLEQTGIESLDAIGDLESLRTLDIGMTPVRSLEPIKDLNVENLLMASVYLEEGERIPALSLTKLVLHDQAEELIGDIGKMESLEELTIYNYEEETLDALLRLKHLKLLDLYGGSIRTLEGIENFPMLDNLVIGATRISDISPLHSLKLLRTLGIEYSFVKDMSALKEMDDLRQLGCDTAQKKALDAILPEPSFEIRVYETAE